MNKKQIELINELNNNLDDSPKRLERVLMDIHGTDIFPDDWRYKFISELISNINDHINYTEDATPDSLKDCEADLIDNVISIYHDDLSKWFAASSRRGELVNESLELMTHTHDIYQHLQFAQATEINGIFDRILDELEKLEDQEEQ